MNSLGKSMILGLRTTCQYLNKTKFYTWADITMKSHVVRGGYNIDDLLKQIENALSDKNQGYYGSKNDRHSVNNATQ